MGKQTGLASNFYIGGYDLSGNVNALSKVNGGPAALPATTINQSGQARLGGERDGALDFTTLMDPAAGAEHAALSPLPTADTIASFFPGPLAIGAPAASINCKQVDYNPNRATDGGLIFTVSCVANGFGLEWGTALTAGLRTDTSATAASSANSFDTGASASFGAQAYLQVTAFAGTSVTVSIWDSADNSTFAAVSGLGFTAVTAAPAFQRISIINTATVRRYVAVATAGTFTNAVFAVQLCKNAVAGVTF